MTLFVCVVCMMIDTIELYILILVCLTITLVHGYTKFSVDWIEFSIG